MMEFEYTNKVLFIDDDFEFLEQVKESLDEEEQKIDVISVSSVNKGLNLLDKENFDAIIIGYQLLGMDGIKLLSKVKKEKNIENFHLLVLKSKLQILQRKKWKLT